MQKHTNQLILCLFRCREKPDNGVRVYRYDGGQHYDSMYSGPHSFSQSNDVTEEKGVRNVASSIDKYQGSSFRSFRSFFFLQISSFNLFPTLLSPQLFISSQCFPHLLLLASLQPLWLLPVQLLLHPLPKLPPSTAHALLARRSPQT